MTVRQAAIEDLKQLSSLFNAYRVFYKQESDVNGAQAFLSQRFQNKDSIILVAIRDSQIVGFTQLYPLFSSVFMQRTYVLNDLYVDTAHRQMGIGELLLNAAKKFAISEGAKGLTLETDVDNPAQKLYERLDWKKDLAVLHYTWTNTK